MVGKEIIIATLLAESGETGVQTHFSLFSDYLRESGHRVEIITPFSAPKCIVYPVFGLRKVIDLCSSAASVVWYRFWHYATLRFALRRRLALSPDAVVYAQCPLSAKAAIESRGYSGQKVIMAVHFNISQADEWADKGMIKSGGKVYCQVKKTEKVILPRLDGIVYVSKFMKEKLEERLPMLCTVPTTIIPNFLNREWVNFQERQKFRLVTVGTLEPRKNQSYLLHIIAAANSLGVRFTLTVIGDGPERINLQRLAVELGITEQVNFIGFRADAIELLSEHWVYVHSAIMENLPLTVIEAMCCGLPFFVPRVGGIPEMFDDGVEGFFWPLDKPESCASKLIALANDDVAYTIMSHAAYARYQKDFTTDSNAYKLVEFLNN